MNPSSRLLVPSGVVVLVFAVWPGLSGCTYEGEGEVDVRVFAENAVWTRFNDERAILVDSTLYIGHVDTAGAARVTVHALGTTGGQIRQ